jgi:hypothetical protein
MTLSQLFEPPVIIVNVYPNPETQIYVRNAPGWKEQEIQEAYDTWNRAHPLQGIER